MKVALLLACSLLLQGDTEPSVAVPRHSLVVQPIVVRGDAGEDPAAMRFLDQAVTRSYTRAETRCHFLEAIYFDDTEARDGEVNLLDAAVLYDLVEGLRGESSYKQFIGGLGLYGTTAEHGPFIHIDVRGYRARWGT